MLIKDNVKILLIAFIFSCNSKQINKVEIVEEYRILNFSKYQVVYKICLDTLTVWENDCLDNMGEGILYPYRLDSIFIFNKDSSMLFTTINFSSSPFKDATADDIREFGGAKVKGKWYFFFMASMVVPREFYQDSLYAPLTFEELSWVSHKEILGNYIKKNEDGSFSANEDKLKYKFENPFGYGKNADWDSSVVTYCTQERKKKIDPAEIARIKSEMEASVRPPEPKKWWQQELIYPWSKKR